MKIYCFSCKDKQNISDISYSVNKKGSCMVHGKCTSCKKECGQIISPKDAPPNIQKQSADIKAKNKKGGDDVDEMLVAGGDNKCGGVGPLACCQPGCTVCGGVSGGVAGGEVAGGEVAGGSDSDEGVSGGGSKAKSGHRKKKSTAHKKGGAGGKKSKSKKSKSKSKSKPKNKSSSKKSKSKSKSGKRRN